MNTFNVTVREIGLDGSGLEVTFRCSKELLKEFNGRFPMDVAQQFGETLLQEMTNNAGIV